MNSIHRFAFGFALFVLMSVASSAEVVTLTYQGQYTTNIPGLFDGSPVTRVEVDIKYPLEGSVINNFTYSEYYDAQVTEVRFGNGTPGATGDITSVYATFAITNGGGGTIEVADIDVPGNGNPDYIWLMFTNGFQTATDYNGNKPLYFYVRVDYNNTNWIRGGMPIPLPPQGSFGGGTIRDFTIISNGTPSFVPFFSTRRFYIRPTNSASIASAGFWPSFTFTTEANVRYQPEWAPVIDTNAWTRFGSTILTETQQVVTVSDTNNAIGQAFYRVSVVK